MNFKSKKIQNFYIIFLLVAIILIFAIDVIQANSSNNNYLVIREKSPILDEEIEAYIPDEEVIVEDIPKSNITNTSSDYEYNAYEESDDVDNASSDK